MNASSNGYVIDTCSIIDLEQICPRSNLTSLWGLVEGLVIAKRLICPSAVQSELKKGTDDLAKWVGSLNGMVTEPSEEVSYVVREINSDHQDWASQYKNSADPWVIAEAKCRGWAVVTQEKGKMLEVCRQHLVEVMDILGMIRNEGWQF